MNIKNNKRKRNSIEKIENVFFELLKTKELNQITVSEICKLTGLNRSTFYANFLDIYDLADKIRDNLEKDINELYENDMINNCANDYLKLFYHIKDNQLLYKTYFKLGYDTTQNFQLTDIKIQNKIFPDNQLEYHIEFHKAGLNAIIKKWLLGNCVETPEEMYEIIKSEYNRT